MFGIVDSARILELSRLGSETILDMGFIAVLELAVLDAGHLVRVLFWEDLAVMDGLNRGVVVVLVYLAVDSLGDILVVRFVNMLVLDGGVHGLVDGGIMLSILRKEVCNCGLCFIHYD